MVISVGGPFHAGGVVRSSSGMIDRLRLRRIVWRKVFDRSMESGWSFDWTLMTKAEQMAGHGLTWKPRR